MSTRRLTAVVTSAYISAMLSSSMVAVHGNASLAATIDPMATQRAMGLAISAAQSWGVSFQEVNVPEPKASIQIAQQVDLTVGENTIEDLIGRILYFTLKLDQNIPVHKSLCGAFDICPTNEQVTPSKQISMPAPDGGKYVFMVPLKSGYDDIVIGYRSQHVTELQLIDRRGRLKKALIDDSSGVHLISVEQATPRFRAVLSALTEQAKQLAPAKALSASI